jgi:lambda family phage minor tail protein L
MTIASDIQKLEPGDVVVLYEIDMTMIGANVMRLHGYPLSSSIWWQGNEYIGWAIDADGFDITSDSQQPVPTVTVGNIGVDVDGNPIPGVISGLCLAFDDLIDAKVIRHQTFKKYLDAVNFADGNSDADPEEHFPDDVFFIEQRLLEVAESVQFELRGALDLSTEQVPNKQIIANVCWWARNGKAGDGASGSTGYRGSYCQYTGDAMFDEDGNPTTDPALDQCSGSVSACKLRFGEFGILNFGSYAAAGLVRT